MKNIMLVFLVSATFYRPVFAQPPGEEGPVAERIEAMKVAFITNRLGFTTKESQEFWPLYNEYRERQKDIRQKSRPEKPLSSLTDGEAEAMLYKNLETEKKLLALREEYIEKFREILSARQILMLHKVERDFNKELIRQLQRRRSDRNRRYRE